MAQYTKTDEKKNLHWDSKHISTIKVFNEY